MISTPYDSICYSGDGSTTAWPYSFPVYDADVIRLILIDTDGTQTEITDDYYVDVAGDTVYYPGYAPGEEPPEEDQPPKIQTGQKLVVYRVTEVTQESDLGEKWPFFVIEKGLDKLTMILQEAMFDLSRSLKISVGSDAETTFDATIIPIPGRAIEVNNSGTGFVCVDSPSTVLAQCEAIQAQVAEDAAQVAEDADNVEDWASDAEDAADAAVQANNSAQGALIDADALLQATKAYISAATVDGFWNSATEYDPGDCVMTSDGAVYRCIQTSTNNPPATSPSYWVPITTVELYTFEYDTNGDLMPLINPNASQNWDIDENDDIMPADTGAVPDVDDEEY